MPFGQRSMIKESPVRIMCAPNGNNIPNAYTAYKEFERQFTLELSTRTSLTDNTSRKTQVAVPTSKSFVF